MRNATANQCPPVFYTLPQMVDTLHLPDTQALYALADKDVRFPVPVDVAGQPCWIISEVQRWAKKLDCYRFEDV